MSPRQPDFTEAVEHLKNADPKMAALIERVGPCTMQIRHHHSIFYTLMRAITYQQLAGAAAAKILARVEQCCLAQDVVGTNPLKPKDGLNGAPSAKNGTPSSRNGKLPIPEQVLAASDEVLRAAGLSRNKMAAIRDLAAKTLDGTVPELAVIRSMDDEEIIERITQVRGIGRWTVEMLLMFRLGRTDVLPVDDYGVRKGAQVTYRMRKLPDKKRLTKVAEKWRPWRSVGSWYMWRAVEIKTVGEK
jgi:3-methyladenine DNA glycosylase/8-oxoguanine DNA glycosylase